MSASGVHSMPFGAELEPGGRTRFRLWAPDAARVELCIEHADNEDRLSMSAAGGGWYEAALTAPPGTRYRYRIDGGLRVPDPASRSQPEGPHGPSEVVDPRRYVWRCDWRGRPWREAVVYELHIGTLTETGTFESAIARLEHLASLGITALEIMPVASFPGRRNWGYDGVLPYAPAAVYGGPDGLRALVDAAHEHGLMVLLDVVYNHFGPDGNYLNVYARRFFTDRHRTPWGDAINFDGPDCRPVRDFFIHNALYWLTEFRLDGLRLDAVHAIADDSEPDILAELASTVDARFGDSRPVHLVLENDRNETRYLRRDERAGYAAQWNDDFHHAAHALVTTEGDGYYSDFADRPLEHLCRCLSEGFAFQGEPSGYRGDEPRGERSRGIRADAFIAFLQNHDQIGNRAFGERLTSLTDDEPLRALVTVLLLAPSVPGLFMGEEFGCRQPFHYFADFTGDLAAAVRDGRRREFARFERFGDRDARPLPDPMADATFQESVIDWSVLDAPAHAAWTALFLELLATRRAFVVSRLPATSATGPGVFGESGVALRWRLSDGAGLALLANLGPGPVGLEPGNRCDGRLLHAEPIGAEAHTDALPPWSVVWRMVPKR